MTPELTKPQYAQEQLSDLNQTLEKEKVELTQAVEKYTRDHVRIVHNKLQAGEPVYENELAFIPKVKMWMMMPKELREKYPSVEDMEKSGELKDANKRHISLKQWLDLLHVADAAEKNKEWIDETFEFPGGGKIKVNRYLDLRNCKGLKKLPEGLSFGGNLSLANCTGLTELCQELSVRGNLNLRDCTGLIELPEGLTVGGILNLAGCTSLTELPEGLEVGIGLWLYANLNEQVKKDAERLKREGKIGGEIKYLD